MPIKAHFSQWLNNLPVRFKLLALTGLVSGLTLCISVTAITFSDWRLHRELMLKNAQAQIEILAGSSEAALLFGDAKGAQDNLAPLSKVQGVVTVVLFDASRQPFAEYYRDPNHKEPLPPLTGTSYEEYRGEQLVLYKAIVLRGQKAGFLLVINDLKPFHASLFLVWTFSVGIALFSLVLGWLLFQRMQRIITDPVYSLSQAMGHVSREQDYSVRIRVYNTDELGDLARGFNDMLQQIEKRDKKAERYSRDLEQAVQQRTQQLAVTVESLLEAKDKAERANQAKSRFLANVSHELRTPLNAILGFAEILQQKSTGNMDRKQLGIILNSGKTLLNLINEILDLAKIEAGKLRLEYGLVDVRQMLHELGYFFIPKVESKNLELRVDILPELPCALLLDNARVQQILINLLGNAVKFTAQGHVRLATEMRWLNAAHSSLELHFIVEDTGIGIPEHEHERIFRAFEQQEKQSQNQFGGTGLGLAITKNLVEMMHGEIQVRSQVGQGSCFRVIFHAVEVPLRLPEAKPEETPHQSVMFAPARVLIADDIELNRELLKAFLSDYPFSIQEAANGQETLDAVQIAPPDLILLDIKMPVLNGEEVAQRLKNNPHTAAIPIIAVTAHAMPEDVDRYKHLCNDYLPKPVSKQALQQKLMQFLPYLTVAPPAATEAITSAEAAPAPTLLPDSLHAILHSECLPVWKSLDQTSPINAISDFAQAVTHLARTHDYPPLVQWGRELCEQAESFDIMQMHKTLADFQQFL